MGTLGVLAGQKRFTEAETLLVNAYEGLKARADKIPGPVRQQRLSEAVARLVTMYQAWNKPAEATRWRARLKA